MEGAGHVDPSRRSSQSPSNWLAGLHTVQTRRSLLCDWPGGLLLDVLTNLTKANALVRIRTVGETVGTEDEHRAGSQGCANKRRDRAEYVSGCLSSGERGGHWLEYKLAIPGLPGNVPGSTVLRNGPCSCSCRLRCASISTNLLARPR
jgi:hypothetical protein